MPWPAKLAALHLRAEENGTAACRGHPCGGGNACPMAASVALRFSSSASAPSAASAGAWSSSRIRLSNAMVPSVRVPVLSRHTHVHPGQALDRGQLLHQDPAPGQRDRGHAEGDAGQQDQPLRDHADQRGDGPGGGLPPRTAWACSWLISSSTATGAIAQVT